jgi:streptogramin lyase
VRFILILLLYSSYSFAQQSLPPIGFWREHLPYGSTIDVTASAKKIYTATPFNLYSVDVTTKEIERYSTINGLSETGVSTIKFDALTNRLYIGYTNSNIDILDAKKINNIQGLKRQTIAGDKSIYHFFPVNSICYVSTGIGVLVLNSDKLEIKDSWLIGENGGYVKTNMFTKDNFYFYAATDEGLKRTAVSNQNPADFRSWENVSGTNGLTNSPAKGVVHADGKIFVLQNDSLFLLNNNQWNYIYSNGLPVTKINESDNKIIISQGSPTLPGQVVILNSDGSVSQIIKHPTLTPFPQQAVIFNKEVWVADAYNALSRWSGNTGESYRLNSPHDIASGKMLAKNNSVYISAGSVNDAWNYMYNGSGIFKYNENNWNTYNRFYFSKLDSLLDFVTLAIDPRDESVWSGSYGGGLLHIKNNNQFDIYKQNSPIGPAIGDPSSYRISGLAFDQQQNLWIANYGAEKYLHALKSNGSWQSFSSPFSLFENAVADILIDDLDQKWIIAPKGGGLLVFNHGSSIENAGDDKWKQYKAGAGNGNLPSNNVLSIAKDKNGFLWIGTTDGIAVIQCQQQVFTLGCEAIIPVAQQGNVSNYLFKGEEIRSIAIDGADRKWIATKNGVWLINAEGNKVIEHFTEENSPLFSNDVKQLTINGSNGEVFIATSKGIISFRGTATEARETEKSLVIYPNPVLPGFTGTIGIKGVPENSIVKITELNGRLVYQTRSLGGQAIWNGRDYKGNLIASGVYLVFITDEQKQEKLAGKIVFIAK